MKAFRLLACLCLFTGFCSLLTGDDEPTRSGITPKAYYSYSGKTKDGLTLIVGKYIPPPMVVSCPSLWYWSGEDECWYGIVVKGVWNNQVVIQDFFPFESTD